MFANANNPQFIGGTFNAMRDVHNHYYGGNDSTTAISRILQAIPNFRKIYQDMLSKATDGTGMWLLKSERFRVWLEPNGDIKIYWGSGMRTSTFLSIDITADWSWQPALERLF
jgi:c-di-GMP-binding flagellar brake protein YcgR